MKKTVSALCAVAVMLGCGVGTATADSLYGAGMGKILKKVSNVKCEDYTGYLTKVDVPVTEETSFEDTIAALEKSEKFQKLMEKGLVSAEKNAKARGIPYTDAHAKNLKKFGVIAYAKQGVDCELIKGDKEAAKKALDDQRKKGNVETDAASKKERAKVAEEGGFFSIFTALSSSLSG